MRLWVDEGHGGADSGAVGGGKVEDARNLSLGEAVEAIARLQGWQVESTREKDIFVTLQERYKDANAYHADVFVSIHHDWIKGEQAVIFANQHDVANSKRLADHINRQIDPILPNLPNGGIYGDRRGLAVLKGTNMPAVIVEASRVQDVYSVHAMADAIVKGICSYKGVPFRDSGVAPKPPAPKPKPVPPTLKFGSRGEWVTKLQGVLNSRSGSNLKRDGIFGSLTYNAVRNYQHNHGLVVDGIVGPKTWGHLGY